MLLALTNMYHRLRQWSVGGDFGEEHNRQREMSHEFANRGYIKSTSSLPVSEKDEAYIVEQIVARSEAKADRDFDTADSIRDELKDNYEVIINDKLKLWSVGGLFDEDPRAKTRKIAGVYRRRGGGDLDEETVGMINAMLLKRYNFKKDRQFEAADAIRDGLYDRYKVKVDDRSMEWRIETDDYFPADTGTLSEEDIAMISDKVNLRAEHKRNREYEEADDIRDTLKADYDVAIDDRTREWSVSGRKFREPKPDWGASSGGSSNSMYDTTDDDEFFDQLNATLEDELVGAKKVKDGDKTFYEELGKSLDDELDEVMNADIYQSKSPPPSSNTMTEEELTQLTVPVLKEKLREAGLKVSGKKAELVERLLAQ